MLIQCPRRSTFINQHNNYDPTYSNTYGLSLAQEGLNRHVGPCDCGTPSTFFLLPALHPLDPSLCTFPRHLQTQLPV